MRKRLAGIAGVGDGDYPRGTLQPHGRRAVAAPATTTLPPLPVQPALPSSAWPDPAIEPTGPLVRQGRGSSLPPLAPEEPNPRQHTSSPTSDLPKARAPITLRVATRAVSMATAAASAVNRAKSQRRDTLQPVARVPPGNVLVAPPASSRSNESEALLSSRTGATEVNSWSGAVVATNTESAQLSHHEDDEGSRPLGPEKHAEAVAQEAARSALTSASSSGLLRPAISRTLGDGSRTSPEEAARDAAKEALMRAQLRDAAKEALMRAQVDESLALAPARTIEESPELQGKHKAKERFQHAFFEQRDRGLSPTSAALEILRRCSNESVDLTATAQQQQT
jgi:hypothetical protein